MNTATNAGSNTLQVRVYNVGFGDAILISVPDRGQDGQPRLRHLLLDVGNVLGKAGGADAVFGPVVRNIQKTLNGQPLDLFVLTHEHLDHVQGLYYAWRTWGIQLNTSHAWLTASAEGQPYYDRHPDARRRLTEYRDAYRLIDTYLQAAPDTPPDAMQALMLNNNPRSTETCVEYLRQLAGSNTYYMHRARELAGTHPFQEAKLEIWAPEEDTSVYYHKLDIMALGITAGAARSRKAGPPGLPVPPPGVDAGAFYSLVQARAGDLVTNLLGIDGAANNTSLVLCLEWHGWRLLFPGDAEQRSWQIMAKQNVLKPVHFLKISHHGSANGMPPDGVLDVLLPAQPPDDRTRCAVVSTQDGVYQGVPDRDGLASRLGSRCALYWTDDLEPGAYFDLTFEGEPETTQVGAARPDQPLGVLPVPEPTARASAALTWSPDEIRAKAIEFAPVARFGKGEKFFPMRVEDYVAVCSFFELVDETQCRMVVPPDFLTINDLPDFMGQPTFLVHADDRFLKKEEVARLQEEFRQRQAALGLLGIKVRELVETVTDKLIEVGVIGIRNLVGLATGGPLPDKVFEKALQLYGGIDRRPPALYYHFVPKEQTGGGYDVLEYWFFYSYNDWHHSHGGVNDHEADWESVFLYFRDMRSDAPSVVVYSAHHDREQAKWKGVKKEGGTHPVVYVGPGSHASFPTTKLHLTVGELKWKRGDVNIGTNGTHAWADLVCLTGQPWVENFDGRWGAHILFGTGPKPGGSPGGPRWGGVGRERDQWVNPVRWAGLD